MIKVDISLLYQIVNFLVLIWVLNKILYGPIRKVLLERKEKISGLEGSIEASTSGAKKKDDAYTGGIKQARADGMNAKQKLVLEAEAEEKEIVAKINEKAQAELAKVKEKIAKDAEDVRVALMKQVDGFANDIGEKILGRAV